MCIIVDPSLYLLIEHICYIPQVFIRLKLYLPSTNGLSYGFLGLFTHCRQKVGKELTIFVLCMPWSECISQEVKGCMFMFPFTVIIFTIHDSCLFHINSSPKRTNRSCSLRCRYFACFRDTQCAIPSSAYLAHGILRNSFAIKSSNT